MSVDYITLKHREGNEIRWVAIRELTDGNFIMVACETTEYEMLRKIAKDKGEPPTAPTAPKCVECDEYKQWSGIGQKDHNCGDRIRIDGFRNPELLKQVIKGGCPKVAAPKPSQETPSIESAMSILEDMFEASKPSEAATTGIFQGKTGDVYDAVKAASVPVRPSQAAEDSLRNFAASMKNVEVDMPFAEKRTPDEIRKGVAEVRGKAPENQSQTDARYYAWQEFAPKVDEIKEKLDALENWKTKANDALIAVDNNQLADRETVNKWSEGVIDKLSAIVAKLTEFQTNIDALFACETVAVKEIKDLQAENKTNEEHLKIDKDTIFGLLEKHSRRLDALEKRLLAIEKRPITKSARILRKLHDQVEMMTKIQAEIDELKGKVKK